MKTKALLPLVFLFLFLLPPHAQRADAQTISCANDWFFEPLGDVICPNAVQTSHAVFQPFENGAMYWLEAEDAILVLYRDRTWERFDDIFDANTMSESDPAIVPPAGIFQPVRGFGLVWRTYPRVQEKMGWALSPEMGFTARSQVFSDGEQRLVYLEDQDGNILSISHDPMRGYYNNPVNIWATTNFFTPQTPTVARFNCGDVTEISQTECQALVDFFASTHASSTRTRGWKMRWGWVANNTPCQWIGVQCANGHVVGLDLSGDMGLTGELPASIGNLTHLQHLDLRFTPVCFGGCNGRTIAYAQRMRGDVPAEIGNLTQLRTLDLSGHGILSGLPASIGNLTQLETLHANYYAFASSTNNGLPETIGQLHNLRELSVAGGFGGNMPTNWASLTKLETLHIVGTRLQGTLPASLGQLTALKELHITSNNIGGNMPASLGNLTQLQHLDLSYNNLSGQMPASLGNLTQLKTIDLDGNHLTGNLPPAWGNLHRLESVELAANQLSGVIPVEWGQMTQLQTLNLAYNYLSGELPASLGNLKQLETLHLARNWFRGEMPASIGTLWQLKYLGVNGNPLSGALSANLTNLNLTSFNMSDTNLCVPNTPVFQTWLDGFRSYGTEEVCDSRG